LSASAKAYERDIEQRGGIDLQILGIGTDGHIGFNEVGSSLGSRTRLKTLTRRTRQDNARYFASIDDVPTMALTMGIATILESQSILLMATGAGKARAVAGCVDDVAGRCAGGAAGGAAGGERGASDTGASCEKFGAAGTAPQFKFRNFFARTMQ
jgi:glucosamine-6-phosphate deaminase